MSTYSRYTLTIDIADGETAEKVQALLTNVATKTGGRLTRSQREITEEFASGHLAVTRKNTTLVKPTRLKSK